MRKFKKLDCHEKRQLKITLSKSYKILKKFCVKDFGQDFRNMQTSEHKISYEGFSASLFFCKICILWI